MKVRIGIIGMGRMGITHYSIINTHPSVEVVSVSDTSKLILSTFSKLIPNLKTYTDYVDQLNANDLDGVIVCTPPTLHHRVCKMACEKGIAVFCEKPFTTDPMEAKDLAEMFEKAGIVNEVGYVYRYWESFSKVKEILESGVLGKILNYKTEMLSATIIKPQTGEGWRAKRENGGGATYEMASHVIDLMDYFIGVPKKVCGSALGQIYSTEVEDTLHTTLIHENGCVGQIHVNWSEVSYRKPMIKIEIFGEKGKMLVDLYALKVYMFDDSSKDYPKGWTHLNAPELHQEAPFYVRGVAFTKQLYDFVDKIIDKNHKVLCSFRDGYNAQAIIHRIFDDSKNNA